MELASFSSIFLTKLSCLCLNIYFARYCCLKCVLLVFSWQFNLGEVPKYFHLNRGRQHLDPKTLTLKWHSNTHANNIRCKNEEETKNKHRSLIFLSLWDSFSKCTLYCSFSFSNVMAFIKIIKACYRRGEYVSILRWGILFESFPTLLFPRKFAKRNSEQLSPPHTHTGAISMQNNKLIKMIIDTK